MILSVATLYLIFYVLVHDFYFVCAWQGGEDDLIIISIASTLEMTRNYGKMIAAKSLGHEVILTVWNTPETNNLLGPIDVTNQSRDSEIKKSGETVTFFLIKVLGRDHSNIIMMYEEIMPRSKDVARQAGMHAVAMETIGA